MHSTSSFRKWLFIGALAGCSVAANVTGCGGTNSTGGGGGGGDGGGDAETDATADSSGSSSGSDSGSSSGSGSGSSSGTDSGSSSGSGSGSSSGTDSGSSSGSGSGSSSGTDSGSSSGTDSGTDAMDASTACTGSETACSATGVPAGLCVSSACLLCQSPADNANCTTAYGGGTTSYVCDSAGKCVVGNCNVDSDCTTVGQICGVTTANTCGGCTADVQCQTDPNYGTGTICSPANGGTCVSGACTTVSTQCANTADFCCAAGTGDSCVPGNCCVNADCPSSAPVCGAGGSNVCGKCTFDSQCASGQVCNTTTGACASNACTGPGANGGAPGICTPNPNDMCCLTTCITNPTEGTSAIACCPGSAGDTYCKGSSGLNNNSATCSAGDVCTLCMAVSVSNPVYIVDPVNGSDNGTGSGEGSDAGAQPSCALKTITRALKILSVVGTSVATQIKVVGGSGVTVSAGETFPLVIPTNVTVTTQTGPVTVKVASGKAGFVLAFPSSSITSGSSAPLTITTTVDIAVTPPTGGTNGIQVTGTAAAATTNISNLTVTGMLDDGIWVNKGSVTIGQGVISSHNGIATAARAGLHLTGTGAATINVPSGSTPTTFIDNTAHGILVDAAGSINLTGVVTSASGGTGTVETNGNVAAGVWIQQTPGASAPPQNVINGLMSFGNTGGNGMRIVAGSNAKVRNSVFLSNQANGVIISTYGAGATENDNIANIDLGTGAGGTNGDNTFQAAFAGGPHNGGSGICLNTKATGAALNAVGNQFSVTNCATTSATLLLNPNGCGNNAVACASGVCDLGLQKNGGTTANTFDVAMCTQ
jgi:hypothetical protein